MLPGVLLVGGVGLAVAAAWGGYQVLDNAPQAGELVDLSNRAARSKPARIPSADSPLSEERPAESAQPTAQPTGSGVSSPPVNDQPSSGRPPASTGSASTASDMERLAASAGVDKATVGRLIRGTIDGKPEGGPSPAPVLPKEPAKIVRELSALELPADPEAMTVRAMASAPAARLYVAMGVPPTQVPAVEKGVSGRIHVFDDEGKQTASWSVEGFVPQSVTVAADGTVYVGGQGRLAS